MSGCRLGYATRFARAPTRGVTAIQCGVRVEGAAATKTSEVGSHRVTAGEEPAADWTDPPKRGQRRENAGSSGRFVKAKAHRVGKPSVESRWSERDSLGNGRARLHESRVCGWQFVGSAYLPCVKGREARADGSFSRNQSRSTPHWGSMGERVRRGLRWFSKQEPTRSRSMGRKIHRGLHDDRRFGFVSTFALYRAGARQA